MEILTTIGLVIIAVIILIGIIRVIMNPYTGFVNFFMELMLIDWLMEGFSWVIETIGDND